MHDKNSKLNLDQLILNMQEGVKKLKKVQEKYNHPQRIRQMPKLHLRELGKFPARINLPPDRIILHGAPWTGKSTEAARLGTAWCKEIQVPVQQTASAYWVRAEHYINSKLNGWPSSEDLYREAQLLIVDDVFKEHTSRKTCGIIDRLLTPFFEDEKYLIVTTNRTFVELLDIDKPLLSRFKRWGKVFHAQPLDKS